MSTETTTSILTSSNVQVSQGLTTPFVPGTPVPAEPSAVFTMISFNTCQGVITVSIDASLKTPPTLEPTLGANGLPLFKVLYDILDNANPEEVTEWTITIEGTGMYDKEHYFVVLEDTNTPRSMGTTDSNPFKGTVQPTPTP